MKINNASTTLLNASGDAMSLVGEAEVDLSNDKYSIRTQALVCDNVTFQALISWHDLLRLGVLTNSFPACNRTRIESIREVIIEEFHTVFRDTLPEKPMDVGKMRIHMMERYIPYAVTTPRQVPMRFQQAADETVNSLIESGVIARVEEPTEWCSPAFFVPKADGKKVRLVTDFTKLNKFVRRPVHPFPSVNEIVRSIPAGSRYFAKLDAIHGYFQLALDEQSSIKTTFLLPSGRYKYLRAPMGLSSSSDEWCRHSDLAIEGLPWARKIVDDILLWADNLEDLRERIRQVAARCQKYNIVLSRSKFEIGQEIPFCRPQSEWHRSAAGPERVSSAQRCHRGSFIPGTRQSAVRIRARLCTHDFQAQGADRERSKLHMARGSPGAVPEDEEPLDKQHDRASL